MKAPVFLFLLAVSSVAVAQRGNLVATRGFLTGNNYKSAMPLVDGLVSNSETKDDPEAWFLRGVAYLMLAVDTNAHDETAGDVSYSSFQHALALNPAYSTELDKPLYTAAILKFNTAAFLYAGGAYDKAYKDFMSVHAIYATGDGKRYKDNSEFHALDIDARRNAAYTAINAGHDEWAVPLLKDLIKADAKTDANLYQALIEIYEAARKNDEQIALIKTARKQFPDNPIFRNMEINYLLHHSKPEEILPHLEAAASKDPDNAALLFNLGNAYTKKAFPAREQGKPAATPANFPVLFGKAEKSYHKAVQLSPDDADYNYNYGLLYYHNAGKYAAKATSTGKPVTDPEKMRNSELAKALPYFEKSYLLLSRRHAELTEAEKTTYRNSMMALWEIYARNGEALKKTNIEEALARWK